MSIRISAGPSDSPLGGKSAEVDRLFSGSLLALVLALSVYWAAQVQAA